MADVSRRGLLGMLAAGVGAAIVAPGILMPIKPALVAAPAMTATRISELMDHALDAMRYSMEPLMEQLVMDMLKYGTCAYRNNETGKLVRIAPELLHMHSPDAVYIGRIPAQHQFYGAGIPELLKAAT